jgi:hypothetical protein
MAVKRAQFNLTQLPAGRAGEAQPRTFLRSQPRLSGRTRDRDWQRTSRNGASDYDLLRKHVAVANRATRAAANGSRPNLQICANISTHNDVGPCLFGNGDVCLARGEAFIEFLHLPWPAPSGNSSSADVFMRGSPVDAADKNTARRADADATREWDENVAKVALAQ